MGQLVTSKKNEFSGIGCVAKFLKKNVRVNHGTDAVMTCNPKNLSPVDVSMSTKITFSELHRLSFVNSNKLPKRIIIGNEVREYVGIGWVSLGVVTPEDLKKYPIIIE